MPPPTLPLGTGRLGITCRNTRTGPTSSSYACGPSDSVTEPPGGDLASSLFENDSTQSAMEAKPLGSIRHCDPAHAGDTQSQLSSVDRKCEFSKQAADPSGLAPVRAFLQRRKRIARRTGAFPRPTPIGRPRLDLAASGGYYWTGASAACPDVLRAVFGTLDRQRVAPLRQKRLQAWPNDGRWLPSCPRPCVCVWLGAAGRTARRRHVPVARPLIGIALASVIWAGGTIGLVLADPPTAKLRWLQGAYLGMVAAPVTFAWFALECTRGRPRAECWVLVGL